MAPARPRPRLWRARPDRPPARSCSHPAAAPPAGAPARRRWRAARSRPPARSHHRARAPRRGAPAGLPARRRRRRPPARSRAHPAAPAATATHRPPRCSPRPRTPSASPRSARRRAPPRGTTPKRRSRNTRSRPAAARPHSRGRSGSPRPCRRRPPRSGAPPGLPEPGARSPTSCPTPRLRTRAWARRSRTRTPARLWRRRARARPARRAATRSTAPRRSPGAYRRRASRSPRPPRYSRWRQATQSQSCPGPYPSAKRGRDFLTARLLPAGRNVGIPRLFAMPGERPLRAGDLDFGDDVLAAFQGHFALAREAALRALRGEAPVVVGLAVLADRGAGLLFDRGPGHRQRARERVDQRDVERQLRPVRRGSRFPLRRDHDLRGDRRGRVGVGHHPVAGRYKDFQFSFLTSRFATTDLVGHADRAIGDPGLLGTAFRTDLFELGHGAGRKARGVDLPPRREVQNQPARL